MLNAMTPSQASIRTLLTALAIGPALPAQLADYWHQGKAEVCRYELTRSRYGEPRDGHAVLIFVTEDFRTDTQVKNERGGQPSVNVLKLNRIERFQTGLYDYSLMQSTFTEARSAGAELPRTLKTTTSVQDWCGHVWMQTNRRDDSIEVQGHSYFEAEAEEEFRLDAALLEDEVLTQLRLAPERVPVGDLQVIPGAFRCRLDHQKPAVRKGRGALTELPRKPGENVDHREYRLTIDLEAAAKRHLSVIFEAPFPHRIVRFSETLEQGGKTASLLDARLAKVELVDYWAKNHRADDPRRTEFGLAPIK